MILKKKTRPFQEYVGRILFGKISEADVLGFLLLFADTLTSASQNAPSAEDLTEKLEELSKLLQLFQKSGDSVVFEEVHSHLKTNDRLLSLKAQDLNFIKGISFFFTQRNIRSIVFEKGVNPNEIGELVRILTFGGLSSATSSSVLGELQKAGVKNISITEQISQQSASVLDELLQSFSIPEMAPDEPFPPSAKQTSSSTMPPLPGTFETMPPIPDAHSEVEAIHSIAGIVDEPQEKPFEDSFALNQEELGDNLFDPEDLEPEEPEIEYKRLDQPVRAADEGDLEDMVELNGFDDESDQLLFETSEDEKPFPGPDMRETDAATFSEGSFTEISMPGDDEEEVLPEFEQNTTDIDFKEEEVETNFSAETDFKEISGPEWDQDDKEIITDISDVDISDLNTSGVDISGADNLSQFSAECGVKLVVKVGEHTLDGASVKIRDFEVQSKTTCGQDGAHFDLEPGEYDVEIDHDGFMVKRQIEVKPGQSKIMIDLQSIFEN